MLKSLELAFRGSSFKNFPGGEYPRTSLHRSHLQRSYVLPPTFEFVTKTLYYELYFTDHCIKWAFKTWKYRFSVSKFEAYIPGLSHFRVCPPHFLERIVALGSWNIGFHHSKITFISLHPRIISSIYIWLGILKSNKRIVFISIYLHYLLTCAQNYV